MPAEFNSLARQGFFTSEPTSLAPKQSDQKATFIDVGGNGDCGFRAVAAGIIDNFSKHSRKMMQKGLLEKLLSAYYKYFPHHYSNMPGLNTYADKMDRLIKHISRGELIQTMAYALRQMAVTEMCANPEQYRGAFVDQNENTSPEEMRKPATWIDETSIAALSNALSMPIEVQVVERLKTLPMRRHYNYTESTKDVPPVVMKLEGNHYMPKITPTALFVSARTQGVRAIQPANLPDSDPTMPEILAKIAVEDERLIKSFEDRYRQLDGMVKAQELNLEKLLAIYIKGMDNSDYLAGRVACVTVEHGNQDFFDAIYRTQHRLPIDQNQMRSQDKAIVNELIHAIARAITIGQMSEEKVFAEVEATQSIATHLPR